MPKAVKIFVHSVDATNKLVGRFAMYLVFVMIGILLYEPVARNLFDKSSIWAVEMAQFTMAAYYLLGGGFSMILKGHVRMDLLYGRLGTVYGSHQDHHGNRRPADAVAGHRDIFQRPGKGERGEVIA